MPTILFWLIFSLAGGLARVTATDLLGGNGIFTSANLNRWNNQLSSTTLEILSDPATSTHGLKITKSESTEIDIHKSLIYAFPETKPLHLSFSFSSANKNLEDTNVRLYYKNYTGTIFSFRLGNNGLIRVNQNQVLEFYNNTGLSTIGFNGVTPSSETNV
jgi:hypothetical protein